MEDVDKLGASAYAQHWNVYFLGLLEQFEVGFVALQIVSCSHLWLLAITARVHVSAARKHKAIEQGDIRMRSGANVVCVGTMQPQAQMDQSVGSTAPGRAADANGNTGRFGCLLMVRHNRAVSANGLWSHARSG